MKQEASVFLPGPHIGTEASLSLSVEVALPLLQSRHGFWTPLLLMSLGSDGMKSCS